MNQAQTPPGWYRDPYYPQLASLRYWDGARWTEHAVSSTAAAPASHAQPAVEPAPPARTADGQLLAGWWQRVLAFLLDGVILGVAQVLLAWPFYAAYTDAATARQQAFLNDPNPPPSAVFDFFVPSAAMVGYMLAIVGIGVALLVVYEVVFLRWKQATPGKLAMGLQVRPADQAGPLAWSVVLRRVIAQFWPLPFAWIPVLGSLLLVYVFVDMLWPVSHPRNQALHDRFAGTVVVKVPPGDGQSLAG